MRRLILYLITSVFFISSCNDHLKIEKNNDPQGYADSQFVGSWKITALSCDVAYDWNNDGTTERDIIVPGHHVKETTCTLSPVILCRLLKRRVHLKWTVR